MEDESIRQPKLPETDVRWIDGTDKWGYPEYSHAYSADAMRAYGLACILAEREACAKVCEERDDGSETTWAQICADAIRSRTPQPPA